MILRSCPTCSETFILTHQMSPWMALANGHARHLTRIMVWEWETERHIAECKAEWLNLIASKPPEFYLEVPPWSQSE